MTLTCPHCQAKLNGFHAQLWGDRDPAKQRIGPVFPFVCQECAGFSLFIAPARRLFKPDEEMLKILQTNRQLWQTVEAHQRAIRARRN